MTSRERVQKIINGERPDRIAFNFWMDRNRMNEFDKEYGENFRVSYYDADVIETFPFIQWFPEAAAKFQSKADDVTVWTTHYPFESVDDLRGLTMPDPEAAFIYESVKADRIKYPDKALFALLCHPLELLMGFFGMENLFYAIADDEELFEKTLYRISDVLRRVIEKLCTECDIDVIYLAGDICSTKNEIMSREMLERFCFGPVDQLVKTAHSYGKKVFFHTDGNVKNILDLFVSHHVDGINPLQASCNDFEYFRDNFYGRLMVYGGIDNLFIIPDGTLEEIESHIKRNFEMLGKNGGYIASSHDIPYSITKERIDTMVHALKKCKY